MKPPVLDGGSCSGSTRLHVCVERTRCHMTPGLDFLHWSRVRWKAGVFLRRRSWEGQGAAAADSHLSSASTRSGREPVAGQPQTFRRKKPEVAVTFGGTINY